MKKMSKMKKGLVGLTAAAMLAGSCVAGPAFADLDKDNPATTVDFTVNIGDAYTVTVPASTTVEYDAVTKGIHLGEQLKGIIKGKHKIAPNKK